MTACGKSNHFVQFVQSPREIHIRAVTASEARQGFAEIVDAAGKEPVVIQRQKRSVAVLMSMAEHERLVNLNVAEFQRFSEQVGTKAAEAGMTEDVLQGLLSVED